MTTFNAVSNSRMISYTLCISPKKPPKSSASSSPVGSPFRGAAAGSPSKFASHSASAAPASASSPVRRSLGLGIPSSPTNLSLPPTAASSSTEDALAALSLADPLSAPSALAPSENQKTNVDESSTAIDAGSLQAIAAEFASFVRNYAMFLHFHSLPRASALRAASITFRYVSRRCAAVIQSVFPTFFLF
jgi:hypothetical protein